VDPFYFHSWNYTISFAHPQDQPGEVSAICKEPNMFRICFGSPCAADLVQMCSSIRLPHVEKRATRRGALQKRAAVAATTILVYGQPNEENRDQEKKREMASMSLYSCQRSRESSCCELQGATKDRAREAARQVPNAQIPELILLSK